MDWFKIPDILAVASLACAFWSILRRNPTPGHRLWLVGWLLIAVHFVGAMFINLPGTMGIACSILAVTSLAAAAIFFMWATVPFQSVISSRRMALIALISTCLYAALCCVPNLPAWLRDLAAIFIAIGPLGVGLYYRRYGQHSLRWLTVSLQFTLGGGLLVINHVSTDAADLGLNAVLFNVYFGCCLYFWYTHRSNTTAGSIITVGGFLAWSSVFLISPFLDYLRYSGHVENEVWNLPKYVVAVGMLLLLLEKQIERSQHLALHDDLTALANRRLFQDRLSSAMERARRAGSSIALLQIDLDRFKQVNDAHGHHVGDLLLKQVSVLLDSRVRRSDTVARTGGDEFSLILEEPASRRDAEQVANSLCEILAEPFELEGKTIRIGASIGIAIFPDEAQSADSLCIAADLKMYQAKSYRNDPRPQLQETQPEVHSSRTMAS